MFDLLFVNSNLALPPLKAGKEPLNITGVAAGDSHQDSSYAKFDGKRICETSREIVGVDRELSDIRRIDDVLCAENEK